MRNTLSVVTQPAVEPVSVATFKLHARIDSAADDAVLIPIYLTSARDWIERYLARALITQTLLWTFAPTGNYQPAPSNAAVSWVSGSDHSGLIHRWIDLPRSPNAVVSSVVYLDVNGTATTLAAGTDYTFDATLDPPRIRLDPSTVLAPIQHVQVTFSAGYGASAAAVPVPIVHGVLMLATMLYETRGDAGGELPDVVERLVNGFRVQYFG
jgi:Phage gp6-like head-tail connector protein